MKKRVIIIPAAILAVATPATVIAAKHLDTSSTAPILKSSAENWSKTATVTVATAASFGGSDLDHYEYCINDTDNIDDCEWKTSSVDTIRVRNLGTSYVWLRAVSKYGVVSDASSYVITRVDRNKPDASSENEVTTTSITVTVSATDDSGIKSYEYSIDDSTYVTDGNSHTFSDLASGTTYNIKVRITDLAGNTKILNFTQSTNSIITTSTRRALSNFSGNMSNFDFSAGGRPSMPGNRPSKRPNQGDQKDDELPNPDSPELPDQPEQPENPDNPDRPEQPQPEQPEQPQEPEQPEAPTEPTEPEQPDCLEEPVQPEQPEGEEGESEQPEQPTQPSLPLCKEKPEKPEKPTEPEQPEAPTQPEEPENSDSASDNNNETSNQLENIGADDATENSEQNDQNDTILEDSNPPENTSAIEK